MNKYILYIAWGLVFAMVAPGLSAKASAQQAVTDTEDMEEDDGSPDQAQEDDSEDDGSPDEEISKELEEEPPPPSIVQKEEKQAYDQKASSSSGKKIFDWSKHKGATKVPHPFAEKGLLKITKDEVYIYKTEKSGQNRAVSFRVGMLNPVNLENPEQSGLPGATFEENYDETENPALLVDYEWLLWQSPIGKWNLRVGTGFYIAQGNGHFANPQLQPSHVDRPREIFTFLTFPTGAGLNYRLQFWEKQLFVPYGEGGMTAFAFSELRDDGGSAKFGGALATYFAGGLALNLTYFDKFTRIQLDREYGINSVFLTGEYRTYVGLSEKYDFTSDFFNAGFLMEF